MKMKLLGFLMAAGIMALGANVSYADSTTVISVPADKTQNITVYDPTLASRLNMDVLTNQTVNFEVQNRSFERLIFEIPSKKIAVEIPKNTTQLVKVTFSDPIDKNIYYKFDQRGSNLKPGVIHVTDYESLPTISHVSSYTISDAELNRMAEWKSTQVTEEQEQTAKTVVKEEKTTTQSERFIRGYW